MTDNQKIVLEHLREVAHEDNLIHELEDLTEGKECIPETVWKAYEPLNSYEVIEVINAFTGELLKFKKDRIG